MSSETGNTSADNAPDTAVAGRVTVREWLAAAFVGLILSLGVWRGLAEGGGLVGGDTYPYFMPQKLVLAKSLAAGELPLWHHLTGLGYPLHAESQAGVFYPTNQVLYRLFDINTAYNVSILLHYGLAFLFAWRFARAEGASTWPAMFAALIFVYGWFPARISLEWSIIGGVWLPLTLWLTRELIDHPSPRRLAVLAGCLGTHLLAGHFTLAFINQLTIVLYAGLRVFLSRQPETAVSGLSKKPAWVVVAIAAGIGLASVQLFPTYELKRTSQREGGGGKAFDPAYGHMPPLYATQLAASWWYWHSPEVRLSRQILRTPGAVNADTNAVEAHLYWGLIPFGLVALSLSRKIRQRLNHKTTIVWWILILLGLVYATGWLVPVTRYLPGFGFFMGPGRYTIVSALGGAVLAGLVFDQFCRSLSTMRTILLTAVLCAVTLQDLLWSSRHIADAVVVAEPPINRLDTSWIRKKFADRPFMARLLAPGSNVGNLFGVSCVPQYLGLGPAVYYDEALRPPTGPDGSDAVFPDDTTVTQLERLGITHILTTDPVPLLSEKVKLSAGFPDSFLNSVWGRGMQPCYLYELASQPQRVVTRPASALRNLDVLRVSPQVVEFSVDLTQDADVVLKELMFPGWTVSVDGQPSETLPEATEMRSTRVAAGQHVVRWTYEPGSFQTGLAVSLAAGMLLALLIVSPPRRNHLQSERVME